MNLKLFCAVTKADDLRAVREVSAQVTKCGANLYQLLSQEITLRQARQDALAQPLDISVIEKDMRFSLTICIYRIAPLSIRSFFIIFKCFKVKKINKIKYLSLVIR